MAALVFAASCVLLGWGLSDTGIASGEIDPLLHFGAQDEAVYTREGIEMALYGHWMTPTLLGRFVFEKPPLLVWMMAVTMKIFGVSRLTPRLPVILSGSLVCLGCWWIARQLSGPAAGWLAGLLALTSQIVITMSRHAMTDIVMAAATLVSVALLLRDPRLQQLGSLMGFTISAIFCLMVKSVAGLLPLIALFLFCLVARRPERPSWLRASMISGLAIAGAAIWFAFCFAYYRNWFLADTKFQLFTVGSGQHQTSSENHVLFYLRRLIYSDPLGFVLFASAVLPMIVACRWGDVRALVFAVYTCVFGGALLAFRFHSEQYLCWVVPVMIVSGVCFSNWVKGRRAWVAIVVSVIVGAIRLAQPDATWGLPVRTGTTLATAPILTSYCEEHRATDLYVIDVDDQFFGVALPLRELRYGWIDASEDTLRQHPYLGHLGILLRARDVAAGASRLPLYRSRLRDWGLVSDRPIASGMIAKSVSDFVPIIRGHPESDFLVSDRVASALGNDLRHRVVNANGEYVLLESNHSERSKQPPPWRCDM